VDLDSLRYTQFSIPFILLLAALGLWRLSRGKPHAGRWLFAPFALLLLLSWSPFSILLFGTLEWQTPHSAARPDREQAIVVLSAGILAPDPPQPQAIPNFHTYVRCSHAAWLYHNGWRIPVVVTGGEKLAGVMAGMLIKEGVAPEHLWREDGSSSTYENAILVARLLKPRGIRRILLVTEAYHMPRSRAVFRRAGFDVVAAPCHYRAGRFGRRWADWLLPSPSAIVLCEEAFHEWFGLLTYRLRGRL